MGDILKDISHEIEKIDEMGIIKQTLNKIITNSLKPYKVIIFIIILIFIIMIITQSLILWNIIRLNQTLGQLYPQ